MGIELMGVVHAWLQHCAAGFGNGRIGVGVEGHGGVRGNDEEGIVIYAAVVLAFFAHGVAVVAPDADKDEGIFYGVDVEGCDFFPESFGSEFWFGGRQG